MLKIFRHKGVAKKVLWVVTGVIILSFALFGTAWNTDKMNIAGKMYGQRVSFRDFEKAYLDTRDDAIRMYGEQFFKYGSRLDLESQTWDRLLLLREAKKRGIDVSNQEIVDFIATLPYFLSNGKFNQSTYEMIVQNPQIFNRRVTDFEEGVRSSLMIKKLLDQVEGTKTLTDEELKKEYTLKSEKIKLLYTLFDPLVAAKDIKLSEEEIKKYYEGNKEPFRKPVMVNVEYISLNYPAKATDQQKEAVKKQIEAVAAELKTTPDLKAAALKHKLETKESGLFSQRQPLLTFAWNPDLVEKIFAMKQGESSPTLETPDGWQILQLKELKESAIPPFEEVKDEVKNALLTDKGFALAQTKATNVLKTIQDGLKANKTFKELAQSQNAKVEETPLFGRGEFIANMGLISEFQEVTLKMNMQNRLSDIISTSQGPAIIYLDSIQGIDEKQFEAEKENFKQMMQAQARNQAIVSFLTKLKLEAKIESMIKHDKTK